MLLCRYYLSWRNASLNGKPLSKDALAHLQLFAIPSSGTLKLDYVSYQVNPMYHVLWVAVRQCCTEVPVRGSHGL